MITEKRDYLKTRVGKELWPQAVCLSWNVSLDQFISNTNVNMFFFMIVNGMPKDISCLVLPTYFMI